MFCCVRLLVFRAISQASSGPSPGVLTLLELSERCAHFRAYRLALSSFCFDPRREWISEEESTPTIVPDFIPLIVFRSGRGRHTIISNIVIIPLRKRERGMQRHVFVLGVLIPGRDLFLQILFAGCVNSFVSQE